MDIVNANELGVFSEKAKIEKIKENIPENILEEFNDILYDAASQGKRYLFIDCNTNIYAKFTCHVRQYLKMIGYTIYDNYAEDDYDFYGYTIHW